MILKKVITRLSVPCTLLLVWAAVVSGTANAQAAHDAAAKSYDPPRTAAGKPDLNGVWQVLNRANFNLEPHAAQAAQVMVPGPIVPVPSKKVVALGAVGAVPPGLGVLMDEQAIPYQPWALMQRNENRNNWLERDPEIKCYLPGIPRATYMPFPFQIFHNDEALFFSYEYAGAVRNIFLEDPGPAPVDSWMGQSWGYWEDDTLVIETTGQNDQTWLDRAGNFHSEMLKVTERFTRTSDHTIQYEATLEDEKVYEKPWTISMPLYKRVGRDARILQFNCVEFVEELMYGDLRKNPVQEED